MTDRQVAPEREHQWGPLSLMLAIAAGVVIGGLTLGAAFFLLGIVARVVGAILHLAVLVAVAAGVVWCMRLCFRGRRCGRGSRPLD